MPPQHKSLLPARSKAKRRWWSWRRWSQRGKVQQMRLMIRSFLESFLRKSGGDRTQRTALKATCRQRLEKLVRAVTRRAVSAAKIYHIVWTFFQWRITFSLCLPSSSRSGWNVQRRRRWGQQRKQRRFSGEGQEEKKKEAQREVKDWGGGHPTACSSKVSSSSYNWNQHAQLKSAQTFLMDFCSSVCLRAPAEMHGSPWRKSTCSCRSAVWCHWRNAWTRWNRRNKWKQKSVQRTQAVSCYWRCSQLVANNSVWC